MIHSGHGVTLFHGKKEKSVKRIFLILMLLLFLTGCTQPFKYDLDTLEEEAISAEIVELRVLEDSLEFD